MASKYKDDSGVPEPPREGVGAVQDSQNQNEPVAAPSTNLSAPQRAKPIFGRRPTLGDLIGWYSGSILQANQRRHGSHHHLVSLTVHRIARKVADNLTAAALVHHAQDRRSVGTSPLTIAQDFNLIHAVLEAAGREGLIALDLTFFKEARRQCRQDELIAYQAKTLPRATDGELSDLTVYFTRDTQRAELPMNDLMWFAIHSTRRVSEICRLEWRDNHDRDLTGLVHEHRDSLSIAELIELKRIFGVSLQMLVYRCRDLKIIEEPLFKTLFDEFKGKGWRDPPYQEPASLKKEFPRRFQRLCFRALAEKAISESKAAELLGTNVRKLSALMEHGATEH